MSPAHAAPKPRLLVIDDEPGVCLAIAFLLQEYYDVTTARCAAEVDQLCVADFAAVLLDVNLPDISGFQLLSRLRDAAPHVPIVLLSASCDAAAHVRARQCGAFGLIEKPFTRLALLNGLGAAIARADGDHGAPVV